ncbi:hypothetical protein SAMN05444414_1642 [Roseovarius marisflavi]|uniref:Uncharacterized protein n=1 Tax=Roseovarius marisflavi TaxID=1054996 RepID=A0A1M7E0J8_9RHOB|nr:hypothetical protein SAMN05444414_1642 [Roseovarius marisflavi]
MSPEILHSVIVAAIIGLGIYLFAHPRILPSRGNLLRGVIIWAIMIIALHWLGYAFSP